MRNASIIKAAGFEIEFVFLKNLNWYYLNAVISGTVTMKVVEDVEEFELQKFRFEGKSGVGFRSDFKDIV